MYKQLEKLITLTNNDLNLVNRRFGQRTDITSEQLELLRILYNFDRLSQYDLTMKISREQSIVSRWIKKLVLKGYITSQQSSEDLRCKELILTNQARDLISQINKARCELIEARCQCLSEGELDNLNQLLDKLNQRRISL
ncbi:MULTISPECIES: MarR family transcriptional regulator [Staphylococcus]|uniref:MarR family transcriptional regulator n=2 Tax=Staphylococcus TaxID=1279 RepID=A0A2K4AL25_9STAP|nr:MULTISPECIES: MarR family transcriptional regulator [Staphylococcus]MBE5662236.1 MarR family transcriptional regulator [Staphylococcus singaporensis]MBO0928251.1 MarR family transcriptional regulator [Staphylococcus sp. 30403_3112M30944]MBO0945821.1 MarR family transcriptional regulator [Staphylococcus sp. 30402_3112M30943]MBO0963429.1 MarR family transcriptional regulator [Staphylococcus sp. 30400_3112M30941]MBO0966595.1 MarR family transcriptional regulator [Staphylococcus sp. 30401_3112M